MRLTSSTAALAALALRPAVAILVVPDSPCDQNCGNVLGSTTPADIVCGDMAYSTTAAGTVFETCIQCELGSTYTDDGQTDQQWMLYNVRYAVSYCLFGVPTNPSLGSNPCITSTACGPLQSSITFNNLSLNVGAYDYCVNWNSEQVQKCDACLRAGSNNVLANFFTLLDTGCVQQPVPGTTISVAGNPFSSTIVNATTPTPSLPASAYTSSSFTLGAKVGIAVGALLLILAVLGFCIVWNGKRRRRRFLKRLETRNAQQVWPTPTAPNREMFETPMSQKPLRGWDDSPMSAHTEKTFPRYFSPYSSQYNSPVSALEGPSMQWPEASQRPPQEIGIALGGDESSGHWDGQDLKGKERDVETYEMHEVESDHSGSGKMPREPEPPVIHHPGNGRPGGSPPRRYGLTEEDARNGFAL